MTRLITRALLVVALATAFMPVGGVAVARPQGTTSASIASDQVIVGIERGHKDGALDSANEAGARLVKSGGHDKFIVVEPAPGQTAEELARSLADEDGVTYASPSIEVRQAFVPSDSEYPSQWHLPAIGAPAAWDITRGSSAVKIAIVDSGVDLGHPDLIANIDRVHDWDFVSGDSNAQDGTGHGTHVAGIAAARIDNGTGVAGVAGRCTILPVRVIGNDGSGSDYDVADGIMYAADQGADVINLSLGAFRSAPVIANAVTYARAHGSIIVAAAGNANSSALWYPAAYRGVIGVGATTIDSTRAAYSDYGSYVDIAAPGGDASGRILSTTFDSGYGWMAGTSMAAAVVSGVVGQLKSVHPTWSEAEVVNALQRSAVDLGPVGRDDYFGCGLVRADGALNVTMSDDEIPGLSLPAPPVFGRVDAATDAHDVFAVRLSAGRTIKIKLSDSTSADTQVRLLGPGSVSVADADVVAASSGGAYPRVMSYKVGASENATYYVDVTTSGTRGTYTLDWAVGYPTTITARPSAAVVGYGGKVTLSGVTTAEMGSTVGSTVQIERRTSGRPWIRVSQARVDDSGAYSATVPLTANSYLRARLVPQGEYLESYSAPSAVGVRASLTRPATPTWVRARAAFRLSGYLRPRHPAGQRSVKVRCFRSENGKWVLRRTVYAKNITVSSYTKYSALTSLPYRGRWKLIASVEGDATHVKTYSAARYLTVR